MNFQDESFVKVYKRLTLGMKAVGWDGRSVLRALFMHVDRAGVLDLDGLSAAQALHALEEMPIEVAEGGMAKLIARGTVVVSGDVLFIPKFLEAQDAKQSDAQRQRESRAARAAKQRAVSLGLPVTKRDEPEMPRGGPPPVASESGHDEPGSTPKVVTKRDSYGDEQRDTAPAPSSRNVTNGSGSPTKCHSRSDQTKSDQEGPPPKDLTGSARTEAPEVVGAEPAADSNREVACPADLRLTATQRLQFQISTGATDYQIDQLELRFRLASAHAAHRKLSAWQASIGKAVAHEFSNGRRRPPRAPDAETSEQAAARLRSGARQTTVTNHGDQAASLKTLKAVEVDLS